MNIGAPLSSNTFLSCNSIAVPTAINLVYISIRITMKHIHTFTNIIMAIALPSPMQSIKSLRTLAPIEQYMIENIR